jgi:hypothetical protein
VNQDDASVVTRVLAGLSEADSDAARAARVRARAKGVLRSRRASARRSGLAHRLIEPALIGGFCLVYFSILVVEVLRTKGLL